MDSTPLASVLKEAEAHPPRWKRRVRRALLVLDLKFALIVILPTLVASLYYGFLAPDIYVSESRFVVRSPQQQAQGGSTLGALLQSTGFTRASDDTYAVADFINSRDALTDLESKLSVSQAFAKGDLSYLNPFKRFKPDKSFEGLYNTYQDSVYVNYDSASSITTLLVSAYTPADARNINEHLLELSEQLLNNMNMRSRQDMIQVAEKEVRLAEERDKDAAVALSAYRSDRSIVDPSAQTALQLQSVAKSEGDLLDAEAQLAELRRVSPHNPQVALLEQRIEGLRATVGKQNARIVGREGSLTAKSPAYDRLTLEKSFADRQLGSALVALDSARSEAMQKHLYLDRLVQPNLPDSSQQPRRLRAVLTVLGISLIAWGIFTLVVAGVREHTD